MADFDETSGEARTKRRRPHKKAKTGCADCRKRRVKCGEEKPECRACIRRGVQCQYPRQARAPSVEPSTSSTHNDGVSPGTALMQPLSQQRISPCASSPLSAPTPFRASSSTPGNPSPSFGIQDMALLHHWTISTSLDILKATDMSAYWQVMFPQIAFKHPFVVYAILSLAALHLAYLNQSDKHSHMVDAARYHSMALQGFQDAVSHVRSENSDALFVWSLLNLLYVFTTSGRLSDDVEDRRARSSRKDRILGAEWIPMIQGIEAVLQPTHNTLKFGPLYQIMRVGNWLELDPDKLSDVDDKYFQQVQTSWERSADARTYDDALWILRKCRLYIAQFENMDSETLKQWGFNRGWSGPLMFIHYAPQAYFTLLHQRQPPALILFAFFGALLHTVDYCWCMEGWGRDIVEVVDDILGSYWNSWIAWPAKVVGL
ncbi:hypothetical protein B0T10DRAFT_496318 [Thelonectria olida]|uniref:Zn(2)-C6 fungal-type domain-containing protein n=1 Tax=Thelonectria olida TaxID=1576542 RepID=A0A9P8VYC0_9HYPO|nr:hypothetical protein B0T10DRAFT_496318 [Thelonectria olida]